MDLDRAEETLLKASSATNSCLTADDQESKMEKRKKSESDAMQKVGSISRISTEQNGAEVETLLPLDEVVYKSSVFYLIWLVSEGHSLWA